MNSQFKFKPDKIKYLSNVDTLDSSHKKIIENINKKRDDVPKKILILEKLKSDLVNLENSKNESDSITNYIGIRAQIIEDISCLEEEIFQIENYEEETEYYSKTYQILFNYYDILDGLIENELNMNLDSTTKNQNNISHNIPNDKSNNMSNDNESYNINNNEGYNSELCYDVSDKKLLNDTKLLNDDINNNQINNNQINNNQINNNQINNDEINNNDENIKNNDSKNTDAWNFDGIEIFNSFKSSKLDILNEMSKMKRKEKKTTRKRVKNVESLIKDNNYNIFDFIHSNSKNDESGKNSDLKKNNDNQPKSNEYDVYDRAILYEDYKISLEGYSFKKKNSKTCISCGIDKILIYSEGIYACMKCGEVENCIVESEITNYKDPMVEKPTFPYKRKNHFCEWIIFALLVKVIIKNNGYSLLSFRL